MLSKIKLTLRIGTNAFDQQILDLISYALADISVTGAYLENKYTTVETQGVITDYTFTNALLEKAVITYCVLNFGEPDQYDKLKASYDEQKAQIRMNSDFEEPEV